METLTAHPDALAELERVAEALAMVRSRMVCAPSSRSQRNQPSAVSFAYLGVLVNLTPLLELDGYYGVADLLDRPNLRPRALTWLGQELFPALRSRGVAGLRGHYTELVYGTASLLYIGFMVYAVTLLYRLTLESWVATVLPAPVAAGLAWAAVAVVLGAVGLSVVGDLRGTRRPLVSHT